jgi:IclR family mhp operon transcriptional activator
MSLGAESGELFRDGAATATARGRRANARRGQTDPERRSYPPVEAVCRALDLLKAVNGAGVATVNALHAQTGIPKPTVVRLLETLMAKGYVARDNMCGGYRATHEVAALTAGYAGIPRILEVARPLAVDLTRRCKWPVGLGVFARDAIDILFWTGAISPFAHRSTVIGLRADLRTTAMGRAWLAFCSEPERQAQLARLRQDPAAGFDEVEEARLMAMLACIRADGYARRDPRTRPFETTTLGVPLMEHGRVAALMTISFYRSAVPPAEIAERVVGPLNETRANIEHALEVMYADAGVAGPAQPGAIGLDF